MRHFIKSHRRIWILLLSLAAPSGITWAEQREVSRAPEAQANSIGLDLVRIPAGEFLMGNPEDAAELCKEFAAFERKPEEFDDEIPRHKVQITRPFWLGRCEVTIGQFRTFTTDAEYKTQAETDGKGGWGYDPATGKELPDFNDPHVTAKEKPTRRDRTKTKRRRCGQTRGQHTALLHLSSARGVA
jgi:formylglycine-generating enzyme required for sulfatase activity